MKKKIIYGVVAIIVIVLVVVFLNKDTNSDEKIKIGVVAPFSGPFGTFKEDILTGIHDVFDDKYQIIVEDDMCDPVKSVNAFKKLIEVDKVSFIIGPTCGSSQEAIVSMVKDKNIIVILPTSASNMLFQKSGGNVFNSQYSLEKEAEFIAQIFDENNYKNVGLVTYANAFSLTTSESFKTLFEGDISELNYLDFNSDVAVEIIKNKNKKFDALFVTDISFFFGGGLEKLKQNGFNIPVYAQNSVELPSVMSLAENVFYSYPSNIVSGKGMVYGLTYEASKDLESNIVTCKADVECVNSKMIDSGSYDANGIKKQEIILKQIVGSLSQ